jgi:endonuclease VIII
MPEGPEVLMMTKILTKLKGQIKIEIFDRYLNPELKKYDDLREFVKKPRTFKRVFKKGKHTFVEFLPEFGDDKIIIHLRYGLKGEISEEKTNYTKLIFEMVKTGKKIYFSDQIGYGDITVLSKDEITEIMDNLGPDIDNLKSYDDYRNALAIYNGKKPIAELIVNQHYISGIGNYLRSEILYVADINPFVKASEVTEAEHKKIYNALVRIRSEALSQYPNYKCKAYENPKLKSEHLGSGLIYFR